MPGRRYCSIVTAFSLTRHVQMRRGTGSLFCRGKRDIHRSAQFRPELEAWQYPHSQLRRQGRGGRGTTLTPVKRARMSWSKRPERLCFEGFWNDSICSMQVPSESFSGNSGHRDARTWPLIAGFGEINGAWCHQNKMLRLWMQATTPTTDTPYRSSCPYE